MRQLISAFIFAIFSLSAVGQEAKDIAKMFATAYELGDSTTFRYVFFTGKHVSDMGGTPEELEKELLPAELSKNRKNPAEVTSLELSFSQLDSVYGHDVWYASYLARGKKHKICLHNIDGNWKVDLSYLWMGDWYDWMPGY